MSSSTGNRPAKTPGRTVEAVELGAYAHSATGLIALVTCTLLGAALASFVGVLFDRLPRGESIVSPASHCAACGTFLRPWDNVPVISWLLLRGRCRHCSAFIPLQFFVLELIGALAGATFALTIAR